MHKSLEDEEVDVSGTVGKCSISKNHGMEAMDSGIRDTEIMSKQKQLSPRLPSTKSLS